MKSNYWLFHIYSEGNQQLIVTINPLHYWLSDECLADSYSTEEQGDLGPELQRLKLYELSESTFEAEGYRSVKELKQVLKDAGFIENAKFNAFMDQYS